MRSIPPVAILLILQERHRMFQLLAIVVSTPIILALVLSPIFA